MGVFWLQWKSGVNEGYWKTRCISLGHFRGRLINTLKFCSFWKPLVGTWRAEGNLSEIKLEGGDKHPFRPLDPSLVVCKYEPCKRRHALCMHSVHIGRCRGYVVQRALSESSGPIGDAAMCLPRSPSLTATFLYTSYLDTFSLVCATIDFVWSICCDALSVGN